MTINTFVLSGEIKRLDVNNRPNKRGPSAMVVVQYGATRQQTEQAVQFLNIALVRLPPYVYEKVKDNLKVGDLLDIVGHMQGVYKRALAEGFLTMEMVADRVQVVDSEGEDTTGHDTEDEEDPAHPAGAPTQDEATA